MKDEKPTLRYVNGGDVGDKMMTAECVDTCGDVLAASTERCDESCYRHWAVCCQQRGDYVSKPPSSLPAHINATPSSLPLPLPLPSVITLQIIPIIISTKPPHNTQHTTPQCATHTSQT
jgi:hypothetical protein